MDSHHTHWFFLKNEPEFVYLREVSEGGVGDEDDLEAQGLEEVKQVIHIKSLQNNLLKLLISLIIQLNSPLG
jgi:hypothetical protein